MIKAIVAVDKNWGIGKNNDLLFHIPEDMKFFKAATSGRVVAMQQHFEIVSGRPAAAQSGKPCALAGRRKTR